MLSRVCTFPIAALTNVVAQNDTNLSYSPGGQKFKMGSQGSFSGLQGRISFLTFSSFWRPPVVPATWTPVLEANSMASSLLSYILPFYRDPGDYTGPT